jgi:hypothetical protein
LRRISSLVACAALVGVGMISATTAADAHTTRYDLTATPVVPSPYVALGDSYSSGAGIMPQVASASAGPCSRSQLNFAEDIAASTHPASFTDVTCSGATTADFFTSQTNKGVPIAPPQLDAVQSDTRLVTMTIGGNDDGAFVASFFGCPTIDAGDPTGHKCMTKYGTTYTDQIMNDTYPNLVRALTAVRAKAPLATVVILGYPQILPPTGSPACYAVTGISEGDVPWLYNQQMVLNDAVRRAAGVTGALYVDTFTPSAGHDAGTGTGAGPGSLGTGCGGISTDSGRGTSGPGPCWRGEHRWRTASDIVARLAHGGRGRRVAAQLRHGTRVRGVPASTGGPEVSDRSTTNH